MEQETCSHSEKDGQAMPQEAEQKGAESGRQGQMNMGPSGGYPNQQPYPAQPPYSDMPQSSHKCSGHEGQMSMGHSGGYPNQQPMQSYHKCSGSSHQGQMNMGHSGGYPNQQPYPAQPPYSDMPQSSHKCSGSGHQGQMNMGPSGGYPNQPPYADAQYSFQQGVGQPQMNMGHPGGYYPNPSHSGMKGHPKHGQSHCSCGDHQQYGTAHVSHPQYGPGHVSEMMGRFMSGNVTVDDMGAISSFFGIDCQSTRFWTGIALGAVGALILTKAFKS